MDVLKNRDLAVGSYHLTIIKPKEDKITNLEIVHDDRLTDNSIMQDCFTIKRLS